MVCGLDHSGSQPFNWSSIFVTQGTISCNMRYFLFEANTVDE